jgi:stage V sporulation protein R
VIDLGKEENLLMYVADHAPHLPEWKRRIIRMIAAKSQYFYPQRQTQVMNEGWASFWHCALLEDLDELKLIDHGEMLETFAANSGVFYQADFDNPNFRGRMNPYTLGIAIFRDIKRICTEPTDEDREWFPAFAGSGDWVKVFKEAMENFRDESFILQYLSPKVIRDFKFFAYKDDEKAETYEVSAIHDRKGYRHVREVLAANYRLSDIEPVIEAHEYHYKSDRRLILRHTMLNGKPLEEKDTREVLKHFYQLWEHPVLIQSTNDNGDVVKTLSCPPELERK